MNFLVNLTPTEEARLFNAATQTGLAPEELIKKLVNDYLPEARPIEEMRRRIREWQAQDQISIRPIVSADPNLTPTAALFQLWAEEDAQKTEEEIKNDDLLWQDYQQGIDEERTKSGMRTLF